MRAQRARVELGHQRRDLPVAVPYEPVAQDFLAGLEQPALVDLQPARGDFAAVFERSPVPVDRREQLDDALVALRAGRHDRDRPSRAARQRQAEGEHVLQVGDGPVGVGPVALAHHVHVGDLENARLDRLDVVAQARRGDDHRRVSSARDLDLVLPHADGLDDDHLVARSVEHVDRLQRAAPEAAERTAGGHAAHEHAGIAGKLAHADPVAEDGASRERTRRVDRDDRDLAAGAANLRGELGDQRRLPAAGDAGDADDVRAAGMTEDRVERSARLLGSRLGAGEQPRDRAQLAGENARDEIERGDVGHRRPSFRAGR